MDDPDFDESRAIDRYLTGRLSADEEAGFEARLFSEPSLLERVEAAAALRDGLREVAASESPEMRVGPYTSPVATAGATSGTRFGWGATPTVALAASLLVAVTLGVVVLRQSAELDRLRGATDPSGPAAARPFADFQVISLGVVRGDGDAPASRVSAPEGQALLLSLELPRVDADRYRVTVLSAKGEALWTGDDLSPTLYDSLMVAMPPDFLTSGSYRLEVVALTPDGPEPAGHFRLEISSGAVVDPR
ncbi:MAG: hypothetical protein AAGM22_03710 [Acidobacteriota bacterium]